MKNANIPAYPVHPDQSLDFAARNGLTKRELIAAMAMQAMLSRSGIWEDANQPAKYAIRYADALLAELAKPQTPHT